MITGDSNAQKHNTTAGGNIHSMTFNQDRRIEEVPCSAAHKTIRGGIRRLEFGGKITLSVISGLVITQIACLSLVVFNNYNMEHIVKEAILSVEQYDEQLISQLKTYITQEIEKSEERKLNSIDAKLVTTIQSNHELHTKLEETILAEINEHEDREFDRIDSKFELILANMKQGGGDGS